MTTQQVTQPKFDVRKFVNVQGLKDTQVKQGAQYDKFKAGEYLVQVQTATMGNAKPKSGVVSTGAPTFRAALKIVYATQGSKSAVGEKPDFFLTSEGESGRYFAQDFQKFTLALLGLTSADVAATSEDDYAETLNEMYGETAGAAGAYLWVRVKDGVKGEKSKNPGAATTYTDYFHPTDEQRALAPAPKSAA